MYAYRHPFSLHIIQTEVCVCVGLHFHVLTCFRLAFLDIAELSRKYFPISHTTPWHQALVGISTKQKKSPVEVISKVFTKVNKSVNVEHIQE